MDPQTTDFLNFFRPSGIPYAIAILAVTVVLVRLLERSLSGAAQRFPDKRLVINQVGSFARFGLYFLGGLGAAASILVLSRDVLLAVGGTVAVSIGFAIKDLVASIIAGLIILIDKPFQVGDRVKFDGYYGEISSIGIRSVRLTTLDDTLITIPNNKFLTDAVASGNAGAVEMMIQLDFFVGIDQDVETAKRIIQEALTTSRYVHLGRKWALITNQVVQDNYFAVRIRAKAYVLDVKYEKDFESDVTERVLDGLRKAGIQPPAVLHRPQVEPAAMMHAQ